MSLPSAVKARGRVHFRTLPFQDWTRILPTRTRNPCPDSSLAFSTPWHRACIRASRKGTHWTSRADQTRKKRLRKVAAGGAGLLALGLVTLGLSRLSPAALAVERGPLWIDTVKRGAMLRQVRGPGTLVPEDIRWIPVLSEARVERILVLPGR